MIKVLVVDDSALVRKLFGAALSGEPDMSVEFARNGPEALQMLERVQPDVITLDIHMPGMDGLECLDRIMVLRPSPVLMVSSLTAEGADVTLRALELGAIDYIAKPGGAVSMRMPEFTPALIAKVRAAASVRVRRSTRLVERLRHLTGRSHAPSPRPAVTRGPAIGPRPPGDTPFLAGARLVLLGASTGGPPALERVLEALPASFPCPIVIAQHMPATFTGPLAARLNRIADIQVTEVAGPTPLEPGGAYVARGDADIVIGRGRQGLVAMPVPASADYPWHPSVDRLVRTAMDHVAASRIFAVLMTGMGDDGAAGLTDLHREGGTTIAEAQESAVIWGMPGALVKAGGASLVVPLEDIARRLVQAVTGHAADA